jgi:hypothetical protein
MPPMRSRAGYGSRQRIVRRLRNQGRLLNADERQRCAVNGPCAGSGISMDPVHSSIIPRSIGALSAATCSA